MNDKDKDPRPQIAGEAQFKASKSSEENGGLEEPKLNKPEDAIELDRTDVRVLGFCLDHYMKLPEKPEDGPPEQFLLEAMGQIKLLLGEWK